MDPGSRFRILDMSQNLRIFEKPHLSFLIFACPKSGTTWMQRLLSSHSQTLCAESRAFGDYFHPNPFSNPHLTVEKYLSILSNYYAPAVDGLKISDRGFYDALLANVLDTLAETSLRATGKTVYGEKITPYRKTAEACLHTLRQYNPNVKFINLVRDGRDVIVSGAAQWLNLRMRRATPQEKPLYENALKNRKILDEEFNMFIENWTDAVGAGLKARELFPNYLDLRYETFLAEPVRETARLLEFLGVDATPETVRECVNAASFQQLSGGRTGGEEDPHSFFRKGVAGDWKNWFNAQQREQFNVCAGALMQRAGYSL
jgi:hypothetical protein